LKLNIGAGNKRFDGYTGIDIAPGTAVDIIAPAWDIPLADGCADEILGVHVFEHLYRWEAPKALAEWARLLKPGGLLALEMPDLMKWAVNIAEGKKNNKHPDQLGMWAAYGDPRLENPAMTHRWGWTFATIKPLLMEAGFEKAVEKVTQFHRTGRDVRDFRVEAQRT